MHPDFWHQRWREGRIGFHQDRVNPMLERHWSSLGLPPGGRVFVPLAGKSLDLAWLAYRGHAVLGVELSQIAIDQFFAEHGLVPDTSDTPQGRLHVAGDIALLCGDVFGLEAGLLAGCTAVYDRAALIALPADLRGRYAAEVYGKLPDDCRGLLVTLDYPPHEKQGPPFSVPPAEVHALFDAGWTVDLLERQDVLADQPGFRDEGVTALHAAAFRLDRR